MNRYLTLGGLAVVLAAAAVLSFDALRGLALAVRIPGHFAWLLPIAVDAGAAVSCATWLGGRGVAREAARFAAGMTWCLIAVTVAGNAGQLGMHAHAVVPPWWVAVAVGTIPPAVVGATVHLLVLVTRSRPVEVVERPGPAPALPARGVPVTPAADERAADVTTGPVETVATPTGPTGPAPNSPPVAVGLIHGHTPDENPQAARGADRSSPTDDEVVAWLRERAADERKVPSRAAVMRAWSVGSSRADRLRAQVPVPRPVRRVK
ncbi:DUF2637 domain-containing protein [Pseudonocardia nigra]|uniref:DUF2637 domain-containing protein n=1 Tax=Pseudonocardia nigra TaxID=1921578 RepID=UPI001C5CC811|nr:DUF2637 domain-containing protein [Pseudonocardia nigra]